ncbi:class I SAM-dependent methyltransferase [Herbiconiux sp. CPCC 203407]|uniref:Class I SAM-dependent methyltransferase n=1 Tax=Herbiconiux oxytropis TaxID=2970915 RepID=A0AA41XJR3_9MICO|nr:class I SAM-dependent methyltransferase [Herbiconiux oxytropis]MCS5723331.1 class I SAM-dependent methyltransferase [Herbiconiux oxytropis]MCS5727510.1 class I SAM-dependent methyltransferase [Herbiconiux oxytropis]
MTEEHSEFVQRLAAAPSIETLPPIADPVARAPQNPPRQIQEKFVGASYATAYAEAERFVDAAFDAWPGGPDAPDTDEQLVLDFGSGWGRITRMLLRRFRADQVWSSDVDSEMTTLLHSTLPGVNAVTNAPWPPTVFAPARFDAVTAFSVFSHLSEEAHLQWAGEFARLVKPGGRVYITVLEEQFLTLVAGSQAAVAADEADAFAVNLAQVVPDALAALETVRQGDFVYAGGGGDDDGPRARSFYAWAVAPRPWVERIWGEAGFSLESWTPTGVLFDQAMVVLQRRLPEPPVVPVHRPLVRRVGGRVKRALKRALKR